MRCLNVSIVTWCQPFASKSRTPVRSTNASAHCMVHVQGRPAAGSHFGSTTQASCPSKSNTVRLYPCHKSWRSTFFAAAIPPAASNAADLPRTGPDALSHGATDRETTFVETRDASWNGPGNAAAPGFGYGFPK